MHGELRANGQRCIICRLCCRNCSFCRTAGLSRECIGYFCCGGLNLDIYFYSSSSYSRRGSICTRCRSTRRLHMCRVCALGKILRKIYTIASI